MRERYAGTAPKRSLLIQSFSAGLAFARGDARIAAIALSVTKSFAGRSSAARARGAGMLGFKGSRVRVNVVAAGARRGRAAGWGAEARGAR